ncbi:MAG: NAD(P)-dependent alcohol dehydrogenase [Kineosporiaceae bacterium]
MKALVYNEYGSPDVLKLTEIVDPVPGESDVLVRVQASSLNDFDWHLLTGRPLINRLGGLFTPHHLVLGSDVAGRVEAVGRQVTGFRPGDEVFGDVSPFGFGAFAELVSAPEHAFARKPARLTMEQAGAVPQAGGLAMVGLRNRGRRPIRPDDAVLVNGAGGGVGTFAVQIAKAAGATVTGVDRAHKLETVRSVGADRVIDYTQADFTRQGDAYDLILDIAAHRPMSSYRRCLKPGGVCAITGGSIPRVLLAMAAGPVVSLFSNRRVGLPFWRPNHPDDVTALSRLLESGSVVPVVDSVVPLDQVPDAFRRFGAQLHTGKIVITI